MCQAGQQPRVGCKEQVSAPVKDVVKFWLASPSLLALSLASGIRNAGGFVWGYQVRLPHLPLAHSLVYDMRADVFDVVDGIR